MAGLAAQRVGIVTMEQWKITRDRGRCEKPGCPLAGARSHFVVLELPDCTRRDLCDSCFAELEGGERRPIFWKAVRKGNEDKTQILDLVSLRMLFERLGEEEGEQLAGLRYFVALLLLRKRVLKMVDPINDEQEKADLLVADPKVPEMDPVALFAPDVDLDELGGLKEELMAALVEGEGQAPE